MSSPVGVADALLESFYAVGRETCAFGDVSHGKLQLRSAAAELLSEFCEIEWHGSILYHRDFPQPQIAAQAPDRTLHYVAQPVRDKALTDISIEAVCMANSNIEPL